MNAKQREQDKSKNHRMKRNMGPDLNDPMDPTNGTKNYRDKSMAEDETDQPNLSCTINNQQLPQ